ncbi:MAG: Holliday junction branch migration protein RuvA [Flavobacteriaceae bacterium]|nr:Holliday junction branch migration protein RuvA [Flavobacteriaceae bacterium]
MITHIEGKLTEKNPTDVVIDCNGVGYLLNISLHTYSQIPDEEKLKLYTHFQVREDAQTLYGFASRIEREIFRLLISVSGIGASTARTMLSSLSPMEVKEAIAREDVAKIQSIKGIGLKTAQRVIVDLRDKVLKLYEVEESAPLTGNTNKEEALSALEVLGYSKKQSERVIDRFVLDNPDASVELIIKEALKNL